MDTALQALISWQFVLFCLAVTSFTYVVRTVADYILKYKGINPKACTIWVDLFLPILPIILGSVGAVLAKQYPYPLEIHSGSGRFVFGLCAGLLSGLVWRIVKATLTAKLNGLQQVAPDVGSGPSAEKSDK